MSSQISETQRSALTALVDTYVPALAVPQDRTGFWAYRASDAGVDGTIEHVLSDQLPESARAGLSSCSMPWRMQVSPRLPRRSGRA